MLSRELEVTLNLAFKTAREKRHEFMTVEHLLLALLDDASASSVLRACGADLDILRQDLTEFIDSTIPTIPETQLEQETQPTHGFQRVLQRAVFQVNSANHSEVRIKPTEYQVSSSPPSGTNTTPRAECGANVQNQQSTRLTVHRREEQTQPHVRNVLQTYKTNRIPG